MEQPAELSRRPMTLDELITAQKHFDACEGAELQFPKRAKAARKKLKLVNRIYPERNVFPDQLDPPPENKEYFTAQEAERLFAKIHEIQYIKVRFHAKSNSEDPDDVVLSVNGETLNIQREQVVIIPSSFLEVADHGTWTKFIQLPNQPRKLAGKIKTYPYDLIGTGTREEFLKQRQEGTKKVKEHVRRFGFDAAPIDDDDALETSVSERSIVDMDLGEAEDAFALES